jgi:predicted GNAT family N-acyltransferase
MRAIVVDRLDVGMNMMVRMNVSYTETDGLEMLQRQHQVWRQRCSKAKNITYARMLKPIANATGSKLIRVIVADFRDAGTKLADRQRVRKTVIDGWVEVARQMRQ